MAHVLTSCLGGGEIFVKPVDQIDQKLNLCHRSKIKKLFQTECVLIQIKLLNVLYNCHIFGNKLEVTSINI